jgi:hypothetical protein
MEHRTLDEMSRIATIVPAPNLSRRAVRRQRLNRLADLLSASKRCRRVNVAHSAAIVLPSRLPTRIWNSAGRGWRVIRLAMR